MSPDSRLNSPGYVVGSRIGAEAYLCVGPDVVRAANARSPLMSGQGSPDYDIM